MKDDLIEKKNEFDFSSSVSINDTYFDASNVQSNNINKNTSNLYVVNSKLENQNLDIKFLSNEICTSKYTIYNAVPKILYEQFQQVSNIYFLILAILQMIPEISQSNRVPTILMPLIMVVGLNGIKDYFEDYKRKKSDERENKSKTNLFSNNSFVESEWRDLKPGNIIKVDKDKYFPTDLILIYSSNKNGTAFVETKNLDGETNLKYKESIKNIYNWYNSYSEDNKNFGLPIEQIIAKTQELDLTIQTQNPDANLYLFDGTAKLKINENEKISAIEYNNFLLRGSSLKNTDFIIGIVIYSGHYSKIMLNSQRARQKYSFVTKYTSNILKFIVGFQFIISIVFSTIYTIQKKHYMFKDEISQPFVIVFFVWFLSTNNLVPISLIVTIEMIRYFQAFFIMNDTKLYDVKNHRAANVQTSGLNEELGQVQYIFSDKTGTLTKNIMTFRYMVIGNKTYGSESHYKKSEYKKKKVCNVDFCDENFFSDFENSNDSQLINSINEYVLSLAICHTVIVEKDKNDDISYNASSPDELSIINAAKYFGAEFFERNSNGEMMIKFRGNVLKYKLLQICEFSSDRKRMSVIVRNMQTDNIELYCKGADSKISPLLEKDKSIHLNYTLNELKKFGSKGLRTLLVAKKIVKKEEYNKFSKHYKKIILSTNSKKKNDMLEKLYDTVEKNLELLGATAIEDCLQDNLVDTLQFIKEVGIKFFMLTGDHPFTAVSIGYSCGLISSEDKTVIIDSENLDEINRLLVEEIMDNQNPNLILVITGNSLTKILQPLKTYENIRKIFKESMQKSKAVICSRVSPKQKADIVRLIKKLDPSKITLSIGDGANDVNMINEADIGIGIFGNEGGQAARASDYSIGQFHFLKRLLFVYGRECYRKNTYAIIYVLWKNTIYCFPLCIFAFYSYFSGYLFYDAIMETLYNILFTAWPVGWFAIYDRETSFKNMLKNNLPYKNGMKNLHFNAKMIIKYYLYACGISFAIFYINAYVLSFSNAYYKNDIDLDINILAAAIYTSVVIVVNTKLFFDTNIHNWYSFFLIIFSIGSYFACFIFESAIWEGQKNYKIFPILFINMQFLATEFFIVLIYFSLEYGLRFIFYSIRKLKEIQEFSQKKLIKPIIQKIKYINRKNSQNEDKIEKINTQFAIEFSEEYEYTGYAYCEDVANVEVLKNQDIIEIKEEFVNEEADDN
jgi:phospholipid-transporting ATPase